MLYREIIAVCSEIQINTLCGKNVELLNVKLVVYILTTGLQRVNRLTEVSSFPARDPMSLGQFTLPCAVLRNVRKYPTTHLLPL
jgi:hypothetical protein